MKEKRKALEREEKTLAELEERRHGLAEREREGRERTTAALLGGQPG